MAVQNFVKRQNEYEASLEISGDDADQVSGDYQVFVSLSHEWDTPIWNHSRLAHQADAGDTEIIVYDGTQFEVGDRIVFLDGRIESVEVSAIDQNTLTVDELTKAHYVNVWVTVERLATRDSANNYLYEFSVDDMESSGQHKIKWHYIRSGVSTFFDAFIQVYQPYIDSGTFFELYPHLELDFDDYFDATERKVALIIDGVTGQSFNYYSQKSLVLDGNGCNAINAGVKVNEISEVSLKSDHTDMSDLAEKDPTSDFYIRLINSNSKWKESSQYEIVGNWGWQQVPRNVTDAAALLIADQFNEDSQYPKHGVVEVYMDTHRMRFDSVILGTTGNLDADILLMDYTLFPIGNI